MPIRLALSLHAADEALRSEIMPVNDRYPLADVLAACRRFYEAKRRMVFIEYVMLKGVNDRYEQAVALARGARPEDVQGQPDPLQPDRHRTTARAARRSPRSRPRSRSTGSARRSASRAGATSTPPAASWPRAPRRERGAAARCSHAGGCDRRMYGAAARPSSASGCGVVAPLTWASRPSDEALAAARRAGVTAIVVGPPSAATCALQVATAGTRARAPGSCCSRPRCHDADELVAGELRLYWADEERLRRGRRRRRAPSPLSARALGPRPAVADLAAAMVRDGYAHPLEAPGENAELPSTSPAIRAPTLAVSGGLDFPDFAAMADRIAADVPGARRADGRPTPAT